MNHGVLRLPYKIDIVTNPLTAVIIENLGYAYRCSLLLQHPSTAVGLDVSCFVWSRLLTLEKYLFLIGPNAAGIDCCISFDKITVCAVCVQKQNSPIPGGLQWYTSRFISYFRLGNQVTIHVILGSYK